MGKCCRDAEHGAQITYAYVYGCCSYTHDIMHITEDKLPGTHTCVANNKAAVAHRFQTVTAKTQMPNQQNHTQGKTDAQGPGLATERDNFANTPVRQCVVLV